MVYLLYFHIFHFSETLLVHVCWGPMFAGVPVGVETGATQFQLGHLSHWRQYLSLALELGWWLARVSTPCSAKVAGLYSRIVPFP